MVFLLSSRSYTLSDEPKAMTVSLRRGGYGGGGDGGGGACVGGGGV